MKTAIFRGKFKPLTKSHLDWAKKQLKENQYQSIGFYIEEYNETEIRIIKSMIAPYRKFYFANTINKNDIVIECEDDTLFSQNYINGNYNLLNKYCNNLVVEKGLYCEMMIKPYLKENRYKHSLSVAQLSKMLAKKNRLDEQMAYIIGIYHDITKNFEDDKLYNLISFNNPYELSYGAGVYHQYGSYYFLKHYLFVRNKIILNAIRHHTLGDDTNIYSKIIFIADKLDPERDYDSSKQILVAMKDINKGFELCQKQAHDYLIEKGILK